VVLWQLPKRPWASPKLAAEPAAVSRKGAVVDAPLAAALRWQLCPPGPEAVQEAVGERETLPEILKLPGVRPVAPQMVAAEAW
jgi:hypothetical protein